jgi:LmeA-like phospholipid-binding
MAVFPPFEVSTDNGRRRLGRRTRWLVYVLAPLVALPLAMLVLPVPGLDGYLTRVATERVGGGLACPGEPAPPARIRFTGGRLLPQFLHGRLSGIELSLPDATIGGVRHAAFTAKLRDVSQPHPGTTHVGSMDASITIGFANMPSPPDGSPPTYGRSPDGSLTIEVVPPAEVARNVRATMFLRLDLRGNTLTPVPQRLLLFGHTVPAAQVASLTGGLRPKTLPPLPDGVSYQSVTPERDGLHVALGGVATTPLSELPTTVNGQKVSYQAENGLLGISSARDLPLIGSIPLTIFTEPRLDGDTLTLVPRSVKVLGGNRPADDPIAKIVLSQARKEDFTRSLPALPSGVRYLSASVDAAGIKVAIGGVTVEPFSVLPATVDGRATTYAAQDGLLAATATGAPENGAPAPIMLSTRPTIVGDTLDLTPHEIRMFGLPFPAKDVLAEVKTSVTTYPLQPLPAHLGYRGVEVLPQGLRINLSGRNIDFGRGMLAGTGCHP